MIPRHHAPLEPEESGRRSFLKLLTHGLSAAFAATLGIPAALYFLDPRNRPAAAGAFQAVAKVADLAEGVPTAVTIREVRRDAWTLHPNDIVGRVWLIRRGDEVKAWNTTCPHLGCSINHEGDKFVCPCHNGTFTLEGVRTDPGAGRTNPAPRDMDALEVKVEDGNVLVRFQVFQQNVPGKSARG
jgi:menaquinol-cytochrome c reductase iron-sulfur subunit